MDEGSCFQQLSEGTTPEKIVYKCLACSHSRLIKTTKGYTAHKDSTAHQLNLVSWNAARVREQEEYLRIISTTEEEQLPEPAPDDLPVGDTYDNAPEADLFLGSFEISGVVDDRQLAIDEMWYNNHTEAFASPTTSAQSSVHNDEACLDARQEGSDLEEDAHGQDLGSAQLEGPSADRSEPRESDTMWAPFRSKLELISLLLIGTTRNLISRSQYIKLRELVGLCELKVTEWSVLRAFREKLKDRLGIRVIRRESPLGTPYFTLSVQEIITQELANPLVCNHLVFMPELATSGPTYRLSQGSKWRDGLARQWRVPMVETHHGQFYLYEPVRTHGGTTVVPAFFYQSDDIIYAKCLNPKIHFDDSLSKYVIEVPEEPPFDSSLLETINVNHFKKSFIDVEVEPGIMMKQYCEGYMHGIEGGVGIHIPMVNPWRVRAAGRVVRHVPIMVYSDDTSGNVSKKWNKHMAYYFTLAGLPSKLSNQDYNIHFLAISNAASALEMADGLVDELNELSDHGFVAYDQSLGKEVMVMVVVLAHLGDGPMHAEISNTMNPAASLSPCRICDLHAGNKISKRTADWVSSFVGRDVNGSKKAFNPRIWETTIAQTQSLFQLSKVQGKIADFDVQSTAFGVRDTLNGHFVARNHDINRNKDLAPEEKKRLYEEVDKTFEGHLYNPFLRLNGFDGHRDTPVEVLHVVLLGIVKYMFRDFMNNQNSKTVRADLTSRWAAFDISGLNIPPIIPKTMIQHFSSLVGKEFRTVMQAAPFVILEALPLNMRVQWIALAHLGSYIFQTEITNMDTYLEELTAWIDFFLYSMVRVNAQWTNKPKFHMLKHLPQSIKRFGPACLVATENMEGYNKNSRNCSVHSNRLSPGRDIAITFSTYRLLRAILCGGLFWDQKYKCRTSAGAGVSGLFNSSKVVQEALGYEAGWQEPPVIEFIKNPPRTTTQRNQAPLELTQRFPEMSWQNIRGVRLKRGQEVQSEMFISVRPQDQTTAPFLGYVQQLWQALPVGLNKCSIQVQKCSVKGVNPWYGMRDVEKDGTHTWIQPQDIEAIMNIQHNCHDSQCQNTGTQAIYVERSQSQKTTKKLIHQPTNKYILNSGSFYSAELHRKWANISPPTLSPTNWKEGIGAGLKRWESVLQKKK